MESAVIFIFGALCVLLLLPYGDALNCHVCNSFYDEGCEHMGKDSVKYVSNCTDLNRSTGMKYTQCRKISQDVEDEIRIIRQCAGSREKVENDCIDRTGTYKVKLKFCHCSGELCNSAGRLFTSLSVLVLAVVSWLL